MRKIIILLTVIIFQFKLLSQPYSIVKNGYVSEKSIETQNGKEFFMVTESMLDPINYGKLFGNVPFSTTLYHTERQEKCFEYSLRMTVQLPLLFNEDNMEDYNKVFSILKEGSGIASTSMEFSSIIHSNYVRADHLSQILSNNISYFLRKVNPKSFGGVKIKTTNLQHLSDALLALQVTTISVDVAYNAALREALATDMAIARLDLVTEILHNRKKQGLFVHDALFRAIDDAYSNIELSQDYFGALLVEFSERQDEFLGMGVGVAINYFKKHYLSEAMVKFYSQHTANKMGAKAISTKSSTVAGLYAFSLFLTYETIEGLLDQHEKVQTAITSATLCYMLEEEVQARRALDSPVIQAVIDQEEYHYYDLMHKAASGLIPDFSDLVNNLIYGNRNFKEWQEYFKGQMDLKTDELFALGLYDMDFDDTEFEGITLGFLIDSSGSMESTDPNQVRKTALEIIIDLLNGNEKVIVMDFDGEAHWLNTNNYYGYNKEALKSQVSRIDSKGSTAIDKALTEMQNTLLSINPGSQTGIMLISDGKSHYSDETQWFTEHKVPIYTVSYKDMGDALLLSKIANETHGLYFQANTEQDVVTAFKQFYDMLSTQNKYISIREKLSTGKVASTTFLVDPNAEYLACSLTSFETSVELNIQGPDGNFYNPKSHPTLFMEGKNYTLFRSNHPNKGKWTAKVKITGQVKSEASYMLEASGKSSLYYDLRKIENHSGIIRYQITDNKGVVVRNIQPVIRVTDPQGLEVSKAIAYKQGIIQFFPGAGQGNYQLDIQFETKDTEGNPIQRSFVASEYVDQGIVPYISPVTFCSGSILKSNIGSSRGCYVGMNCNIYDSTNKTLKATGFVTSVNKDECTIEISKMKSSQPLQANDILELNKEQWLNSSKY